MIEYNPNEDSEPYTVYSDEEPSTVAGKVTGKLLTLLQNPQVQKEIQKRRNK